MEARTYVLQINYISVVVSEIEEDVMEQCVSVKKRHQASEIES